MIRDCLKGDPGAWRMIVDLYSKKVFNLAFQFSGSREEAEDLTQDIFIKLYGSLSKYDFERSFTAWFLTLARNHLIGSYRRTKWEKRQRDDFETHAGTRASADDPERGLALEETKRVLWQGLNLLPAEVRMAVILKEIQGKSYEETAEIMGLPIGTVKSRISRGRLQLAKLLRDRKESIHVV